MKRLLPLILLTGCIAHGSPQLTYSAYPYYRSHIITCANTTASGTWRYYFDAASPDTHVVTTSQGTEIDFTDLRTRDYTWLYYPVTCHEYFGRIPSMPSAAGAPEQPTYVRIVP